MSETTAHELLGQGIVYEPFAAVGHSIGEALRSALVLRNVVKPQALAPQQPELGLSDSNQPGDVDDGDSGPSIDVVAPPLAARRTMRT